MKASLGARVFIFYIIYSYVIPPIIYNIIQYQSDIYIDPRLDLAQILYGILIVLAAIATAWWPTKHETLSKIEVKQWPFGYYALFLIVLDLLAAIGSYTGLSGWRYSSEGLSDSLDSITLFYVTAPQIFEFILFLEIFCFSNFKRTSSERGAILFLLTLGLALVASGLGPMIELVVAVIYMLFPAQVRLLVFRDHAGDNRRQTGSRLGYIPMALTTVVLLAVALVVGEQIKTGADQAEAGYHFTDMTSTDYVYYIIERFTVNWVSFKVSLADYTTMNWSDTVENLAAPIGNFLFRVDVLLGHPFGFERPASGSLMRINYEAITNIPLVDRQGTSPGLIPGFLMAFPMPLSILACCSYIFLIKKMLNRISTGIQGEVTFLGLALLTYIISSIFVSPVDYLVILDNSLVGLFMFGWIAIFWGRRAMDNRHNAR